MRALHTRFTTIQNLFRLVNGIGISIHHVLDRRGFCAVAFIFDEGRSRMVNRWCAKRIALARSCVPRVNLTLNRLCIESAQ